MRKVILLFPDIISLCEFILTQKPSRAIVESSEKILKGIISDKQLSIACKVYGARIKESIQLRNFQGSGVPRNSRY